MCQGRGGAEALLEPRASTISRRTRSRLAMLFHLAGWILSLIAVALAAEANVWTLQQFKPYSWTHSTVDAAVATVALSVVLTVAQCSGALLTQLLLAVALGVVLLVKRSMLHAAASTGVSVVAVVTVAAVSPWIWALGALVHLRHRNAQASAASEPEGGSSSPRKSRGATVGRLLGLARPEYPLLVMATCALFLSTASQMAMPHFVGVLIASVEGSSGTQAEKQAQLQQVRSLCHRPSPLAMLLSSQGRLTR